MEEFKYITPVPNKHHNSIIQWIDNINYLELWLNTHIGPHMELWAYSPTGTLHIAFKNPEHKTYFILAYDKY